MLIAVGAVLFALFIVIFALIFSLFISFGAIILAGIFTIAVLIGYAISGQMEIVSLIFALGVMLILIGISTILLKWTINGSKELTKWFIDLINNRFRKKVRNND